MAYCLIVIYFIEVLKFSLLNTDCNIFYSSVVSGNLLECIKWVLGASLHVCQS